MIFLQRRGSGATEIAIGEDGAFTGYCHDFLRDGMLVTISRPYGVGAGDTFIIYLPGTPLNRIPPAYHEWAGVASDEWHTLDFALYNMTDAFGWNEN